jgi:ABC-type amino acid transport substrate-binding protein
MGYVTTLEYIEIRSQLWLFLILRRRKMKKLLMVLFLGLAAFGLSACSNASNVFDFVLDSSYTEFVTMATSADYPPYENIVKDENGKNTVVGVDIEIGKAIAKALGKNLRVIHKGFDFLVEDVRAGKVDFVIAGLTPTPTRAQVVDFSKSYYTEESVQQVILVHKDNQALYDTLAKVNTLGVRVGAQSGSIQAEFASVFTPNATAKLITDLNELLNNLNNKQIDALFTEGAVADTHINGNFPNFVKIEIDSLEGYEGNAVAVKKGNAALLTTINTVIDQLIEQGKINEWLEEFSA